MNQFKCLHGETFFNQVSTYIGLHIDQRKNKGKLKNIEALSIDI